MRRLMKTIKKRAISFRLDAHTWQIERIREGVKQADAGCFAPDAAVAAESRRWRH